MWVSVDEDKDFSLKLYSDALVPMLHDRNQVDRAWWLAGMLTQHAIGELNMMSYCNGFELLDKPARGESITLKELSAYLEKAGVPLSLDPNEHLKQYLTFQKDPDPVEDAGLFNDVLTGQLSIRSCAITSPESRTASAMKRRWPTVCARASLRTRLRTCTMQRPSLRCAIRSKTSFPALVRTPSDSSAVRPGCTPVMCFFSPGTSIPCSRKRGLSSRTSTDPSRFLQRFAPAPNRSFSKRTTLKRKAVRDSYGQPVALDDKFIPYDPANPEPFLAQFEAWNDADKFSLCLLALDTIPEEQLNYSLRYLRIRAMQNRTILGDGNKGTSRSYRHSMLEKTLELLDAIREEGENQAA